MARKRSPSPVRAEIIKATSEMFFKNGFSKTTPGDICDKVKISTGNLTYHFPTKEHILSVIVKMMCDYQWKAMESATDEGKSSLLAYCLELTTLVALCEEIEQMQDFLIAAYSHPMSLDVIRANDVEKIKQVFHEYTSDWNEERFTEIEAIISGIEYATIMNTEHSASVEYRIAGALHSIMLLFGVPEETRNMKVEKVLAMDYRAIGRKAHEDFKRYVTETNAHALDEVQQYTKAKAKK